MKKLKKIFALFLTLAMVFSMGATVWADNSTTLTIENAGEGNFKAVKVVEPDSSKDTGWDFVEGYAQYFTDAKAFNTTNTQEIIKGMIYAEDKNAKEGKEITGFTAKYAAALAEIIKNIKDDDVTDESPITITEGAGLYVVKGKEENYDYSPMAAFVGMDYTSGKPSGVIQPENINAKKAPTTLIKSADDILVEVNQEVLYTVTSTVPYFPDEDTDRWYIIQDTISGAVYKKNADGKTMTVNVKIGDGKKFNKKYETVTPTTSGEKESFILDLTKDNDLSLSTNKFANQQIQITYTAVVKKLIIDNDVKIGQGTNGIADKYGSGHEDLISGKVTLSKTDDTESPGTPIPLKGAEFVVQKTDNGKTYYGIFDTTNSNTLTGWTETMDNGTRLSTDDDGEITVSGLAPDIISYEFKEVKAPDGYSINETNAKVTWNTFNNPGDIDKQNPTAIEGTASMADTKLASLPSTGGIGTAIFTIGGCVIMAAAAGLFFASRRKQEKK